MSLKKEIVYSFVFRGNTPSVSDKYRTAFAQQLISTFQHCNFNWVVWKLSCGIYETNRQLVELLEIVYWWNAVREAIFATKVQFFSGCLANFGKDAASTNSLHQWAAYRVGEAFCGESLFVSTSKVPIKFIRLPKRKEFVHKNPPKANEFLFSKSK